MSTLTSLQSTLAAEHAAIYLYGDAGAHTSQSAEPELFALVSTLYRTHRARRDQLQRFVIDRGAIPVAAAATYELPEQGAAGGVRRQALQTEQQCAQAYAALVANTAGADRTWAIAALTEAAQARILLGGRPETFPGAPDLA